MPESGSNEMPRHGHIYTLAQSETAGIGQSIQIVCGNGSDLADQKALKGRAKRKMITQKMILSLVDVADGKRDLNQIKSFWNSYHCQSSIISSNGRYYGRYCKNRYCTLCCSIRKATIINKYLPVIENWEDPYFVTLTAKSLSSKNLHKRMKDMNRGFRKIKNKLRKRHLRGKGFKLMGVKSLECNFNPVTKKYNPHLHLIVPNKATAELLIYEWLLLCTRKFAVRAAQDLQPVRSNEGALIEIVKYGSKIFTEPDVNNKSANRSSKDLYSAALYNIFSAMKGIRIFERFGFDVRSKTPQSKSQLLTEFQEWEYGKNCNDWINVKNDERLTGYIPPGDLIELLENRVNKETE